MGNSIRFPPNASEGELRTAIVEAGRVAYQRGLMVSSDGNLSARTVDNQILITPSGLSKGRLSPEDLLLVDRDGRVLQPAADAGLSPSSETPMHLEAYRQRPEMRAVIHAHPPYATALTVAGIPFASDVLPEVLLTLGEIPTTAYATPSSQEDALAIRDLIKSHNAILLRQHGSLTVGTNLDEALIALERLEHAATVIVLAQLLGHVESLPPESVALLRSMSVRFRP
ncbi:MAG TPA: class II aldolase/adducin family protein [Anaerolineales bacterium]|nr:class II aldolase/adducin family protein [Anaerolineales bacterium]